MWARPDLLAELKGLGLLRSPALERSFLHVRQESFLPDAFGTLAYADMPLPVHVSPSPPTMPSANGPCLWGQYACVAKTRPSRLRNTAMTASPTWNMPSPPW